MRETMTYESAPGFNNGAAETGGLGSLRVGDAIYLMAVLIFFIQAFLDTTMIAYVVSDELLPFLKGLAFALVVLKVVLSDFSSTVRRILLACLVLAASCLTMLFSGYSAPFQFLIMVIGASDVDFDQITKVYLWSSIVLTVITVIAALAGAVENVPVPRGNGTVYSYGFYYSAELSSHILFISLAWLYLHRRKLSIRVYVPVLLWSAVTFILTDGRLSFFSTLLVVVFTAIANRRSMSSGAYSYPRFLKFSYFVMAGASVVLMISYQDVGVFAALNRVLTKRLYYAHEGYLNYGLTFFGQQIQMTGWGGGRTVWAENYFYIDNSYVNVLLRFGAVTLVAVLVVCSLPYARLRCCSGVVAILIAAVAGVSFVNEHLMGLSYNYFALMAFAASSDFVARKQCGAQYFKRRYLRTRNDG